MALLATTVFASAILPHPAPVSPAKRQDEWNIWELQLWTSGCDGEPTETFSGHDDQMFPCGGGDHAWHSVKMDNMEATGHMVKLYGDPGCQEEPIATLTRDGTCYSAQSDKYIAAYTIEPAE
ncbi:hypothetical protein K491DRAFT_715128 [Lophiostoma macrostomum CBS 122681]|uniref:Uncharacterized protein n=1 Tax=Lophiostoma macrostomum CBS 122681 TaxID=1314788 RepID=A0A6A6TBV6_9PLEO|nr:hypothetical protein K491DRAFT_715128 [Lophiostoma macrostomum CBS 122681]